MVNELPVYLCLFFLMLTEEEGWWYNNRFKRVRDNNYQSKIVDLGSMFHRWEWNRGNFR